MDAPPSFARVPLVGVGCIVVHKGKWLLVRNARGYWSTPGGHMNFGEAPEACAARETLEETGIAVSNVEFVAITNDVMIDRGKHYLTVWMRGDAEAALEPRIGDAEEILEAGWFELTALPSPLQPFFENLLAGRSYPRCDFGAATKP